MAIYRQVYICTLFWHFNSSQRRKNQKISLQGCCRTNRSYSNMSPFLYCSSTDYNYSRQSFCHTIHSTLLKVIEANSRSYQNSQISLAAAAEQWLTSGSKLLLFGSVQLPGAPETLCPSFDHSRLVITENENQNLLIQLRHGFLCRWHNFIWPC